MKKQECEGNQLYISQFEVVDAKNISTNELVLLGIISSDKANNLEKILDSKLHKIDGHNDLLARIMTIRDLVMPKVPYHNIEHAQSAYEEVKYLAQKLNIGKEYQQDLEIATQGHDFIVDRNINFTWTGPVASYKEDNELKSAFLLMYALKKLGVDNLIGNERIKLIGELVKSTKFDRVPTNFYEKTIRDADMNNLYKSNCLESSVNILGKELYIVPESKVYEATIGLLSNHKYNMTFKGDTRYVGINNNLVLAKEKLKSLQ